MSIRRAFQIATFVFALAFSFGATGASSYANNCDPQNTGFC